MKLLFIYLISLSVLMSCSSTWSARDKRLAIAYTTLTTIDTMQTKKILRDDELRERNPLLKDNTSLVLIKTGSLVSGFYIADKSPEARPYILWFGILLETACIRNNHQLGVRIGF